MQSSLRKSALFFIWGLVMSVGAAGLPGPEPVQGQCTSNDPTAPCFSDNDDILAGQRNLLRNDDLVVNSATAILNNSGMSINNYNLETVGGAVSSETVDNPVAAGCFIGWPLQAPSHVRVGRLFPLGNDVVVTPAPSSSAAGSDCNTSPQNLAFYVRDPQDSGNDSVTAFTDSASWTQMVLEDFDKDGNQDVFFINDRVAAIWAASDPGSPSAGLAQRSTLVLPTTEHTPVGTPVAGDFNTDGAVDVAWPGADPEAEDFPPQKIYLASVCPAANVTVLGQTCGSAFEIILSTQIIDTGFSWLLGQPARDAPRVSLAADNFDGSVDPVTGIADDELLVAGTSGVSVVGGNPLGPSTVTVYSFDADLVPMAGPNPLDISPAFGDLYNDYPPWRADAWTGVPRKPRRS